jgi:hypothetical protein
MVETIEYQVHYGRSWSIPDPWHRPARRPTPMKPIPGIRRRHSAGCSARTDQDAPCDCEAGYEATVFDKPAGKKIRRAFQTLAAPRRWCSDAEHGVHPGTIRVSGRRTVMEAADDLIDGMEAGSIRTRSGDPYKPSVVRGYRASLDLYVREALGAMLLGDVQRRHLQRLADRLATEGASPSTIRNALMPVRVIYRRAIRDGLVTVNRASTSTFRPSVDGATRSFPPPTRRSSWPPSPRHATGPSGQRRSTPVSAEAS